MAHLAILLPDLRGGGVERVFLSLSQEFISLGHQVEFVLMQARGEFLPEAQAQFKVRDLNIDRARQIPISLARYLRRRRPDALIVAMWPLTVLAPFAVRLSGHRCRLLVSEHNTLSVQYGKQGRLHRIALRLSMNVGYRCADAVVGVSHGVVEDMRALSGLSPKVFDVIHNPVPPRPMASGNSIRACDDMWRVPRGGRVLSVGSFKDQKNHPLLLRAFARLVRPKARLMLLGQGQNEAMLRKLAAELGIADRLIFAGFHADPSPFYATADLFALSSDYEGFGNVIVEALLFGLPVVSTDCPSGPAEILDNGRWGRLVPVGDAAALAAAMRETLAEEVDRESLKARARDFAPRIAARKYLDLLGVV